MARVSGRVQPRGLRAASHGLAVLAGSLALAGCVGSSRLSPPRKVEPARVRSGEPALQPSLRRRPPPPGAPGSVGGTTHRHRTRQGRPDPAHDRGRAGRRGGAEHAQRRRAGARRIPGLRHHPPREGRSRHAGRRAGGRAAGPGGGRRAHRRPALCRLRPGGGAGGARARQAVIGFSTDASVATPGRLSPELPRAGGGRPHRLLRSLPRPPLHRGPDPGDAHMAAWPRRGCSRRRRGRASASSRSSIIRRGSRRSACSASPV